MKERILAKLKEYGYDSQRAVARALVEKGYYQNLSGTTTFLNQVVNDKRTAPKVLVEGIAALCNNDPEITSLLTPSDGLEGQLEHALDEVYLSLRQQFRDAGRSQKMRMYLAFEDYVRNGQEKNSEE